MKIVIPKFIRKTLLYAQLRFWIRMRMQNWVIAKWEKQGRPSPPPPVVKHQTIRDYAERFNLRVFVETGTYFGDTIAAVMRSFDKLYSIELSRDIYEIARKRFVRMDKVTIIHGDSGVEINKVINWLDQPALFWLDSHFSGGVTARGNTNTPVIEELKQILRSPIEGHVIIIDDAHSFGTDPDYPSIEELCDLIRALQPGIKIEVENNMIRITSNSDAS